MRPKINPQGQLDFSAPRLELTRRYYAKYEAIGKILDDNPEILARAHADLGKPLQAGRKVGPTASGRYTSDTVLRILVAQHVEGESLRSIVVRIDTCSFLRRFVRVFDGPMMDAATLCRLKNCIRPETWADINRLLTKYASTTNAISGEEVRADTTAVETNIHWPTDSSLLSDTYRVLARGIDAARQLCPEVVGTKRLHVRRVKRLAVKVARRGSKGEDARDRLKSLYSDLLGHVDGILTWALEIAKGLRAKESKLGLDGLVALEIADKLEHYNALGVRVVDQTRRRVLAGEVVPNDEKLFSIFEPHTELLKRGKAGKDMEFGHMIQILQVRKKFITDYSVFERKPVEHALVNEALERHKDLFGSYPETLAADKGYYEDMRAIGGLEEKVRVVSIAKKGARTQEEKSRERDPLFRLAQRFRAGVEGTISFLKRALRLARCMNKGWQHFAATVGATVFAHNLLVLSHG